MFQVLEVSGPRRPISILSGLLAASAHMAVVVVAAIAGIRPAASPAHPGARELPMVLASIAPATGTPVALPVDQVIPRLPGPYIEPVVPAFPDWSGEALPPSPAQSMARYLDRSAGSSPADTIRRGGWSDADQVLLAGEVDQPVAVAKATVPRYPAGLEAAGVSGRVVLEFVVDTTGRVEAVSLRVVSSSLPAFEAAAREALLTTRFRPARSRGVPVRQLARQAISFRGRD